MRIVKQSFIVIALVAVLTASNQKAALTRTENTFMPILPTGCPVAGQGMLRFINGVLTMFTNTGYYTLDENLNITGHVTASKDIDALSNIGKEGSSSIIKLSGGYQKSFWLWQNDTGKKIIFGQNETTQIDVCGIKGDKIAKFVKNKDKTTTFQLLDSSFSILLDLNLPVERFDYCQYGSLILVMLSGQESLVVNADNKKYFHNKRFYCWSEVSTKDNLLLYGGYLIDMNTMEPMLEIDGNGIFCGEKAVFWNNISGLVTIVNVIDGTVENTANIEVDSNKTIIIGAVSTNYVFYQIHNKDYYLKNIETKEIVGKWDNTNPRYSEISWAYDGKFLFFNNNGSISKVDMNTGKTILEKKICSAYDVKIFDGRIYINESETGLVSIKVWGGKKYLSITSFIFKPLWFPTTSGILLIPTSRMDKNGPVLLTDSQEKLPESAIELKNEFLQTWCTDENGDLVTIWTNGDVYRIDKNCMFVKLWHFDQFISKNNMISYTQDIKISSSSYGCCVFDRTQCRFTDYKTDRILTNKCFVWKNMILMEMKNITYFHDIKTERDFKKLEDASLIGYDNNRIYLKRMYPTQMMCFDGKMIFDMPEIAYSKEDELTSWGDSCLNSSRSACITKDSSKFSQIFYNSFSWRFIDNCRILGKAGKSLMEWAPCPTFTIKRTGRLAFEITANRMDSLDYPLKMKVAIIPCDIFGKLKIYTELDKWKNLEDFSIHKKQTVELDQADFCKTLGNRNDSFAFIIQSNGLLETLKSDLSEFDTNEKPMFDGIPTSYDDQVTFVVTYWNKQP